MRAAVSIMAGLLVAATGCSSDETEPAGSAVPLVALDPGPPGAPAPVDRSLHFRDITGWAGIQYPIEGDRGVTFIDADNDGIDDIVTANRELTTIFRGRGDGSFYPLFQVRHDLIGGTYPYTMDATGDGIDDILLVHDAGALILRGFGNGAFEVAETVVASDETPTIATIADFDADGRLDVYLGFMSLAEGDDEPFFDPEDCKDVESIDGLINTMTPAPDQLMLHTDAGWVDATASAGLTAPAYTQAAMVVDLDDDGHLDLLVGTEGVRYDLTYFGLGGLGFRDGTNGSGMLQETSAMGFDAIDVDSDGDLDVYVTDDLANQGDKLYLQVAPGIFELATVERGLGGTAPGTGWGLGFHDFDHDGDFDLFVANGIPLGDCPGGEQENFLFVGDETGHFTQPEVPAGSGLKAFYNSRAAVFSDIDGDGDLDALISNINAPPTLLRNDMPSGGHWLQLLLKHPTLSPVVGARVTLRSGGRVLRRDVKGTPSYGGSSTRWIHFGLGSATEATEVTVRWPDGSTQVIGTLAADQRHTITKP